MSLSGIPGDPKDNECNEGMKVMKQLKVIRGLKRKLLKRLEKSLLINLIHLTEPKLLNDCVYVYILYLYFCIIAGYHQIFWSSTKLGSSTS